MPGRRRSQAQLTRDRRRIADLYLQGWLQTDIAKELKTNQSTVSRDLQTLQAEWRDSALVDIDLAKSQELAKVDRLEREYWEAWERSCEDAETLRQELDTHQLPTNPDSGKIPPNKVVRTSKGQAGDPRFLQGIQWCINKRCEIIGVDAPKRTDITERIQIVYVGEDISQL